MNTAVKLLGMWLFCALARPLTGQAERSARAVSTAREERLELVDLPGLRRLSARVIVRPWPLTTLLERGLAPRAAGARRDAARSLLTTYPTLRHAPETDETILELAEGTDVRAAIEGLRATGLFEYVEPDWIVWPLATPRQQSGGATSLGRPTGGKRPDDGWLFPDDPYLGSQWHHQVGQLDSCAGWARERGSPTVSIGICDTGLRLTHEDLGRHRREAYNAVDHLWESQGGQIGPIYPHGTRTTGTAVASGNNALGVVGVGWELAHRMLRVSNQFDGSAYLSDLQHGARTSIESGDRIASVSYHGVYFTSNLTTAEYIRSLGGLLVWAAGNTGSNMSFADRDADHLVVVGATSASDVLAWFSSYGTFVDLVAPGVGILTTDSASDSAYVAADGTSYACPLVAGLAALVWSQRPELSPGDVVRLLELGAEDLGTPGVDLVYGHGRIQLARSLAASGRAVPRADFSQLPGSGLAPLAVRFVDQSTGVPAAWLWDFGDGTSSSERAPTHTYLASGAHTVSLTVTNELGSDTVVRTDAVLVDIIPPVADFTLAPASGLSPLLVTFVDRSGGGIPSAWSWDFGDGASSSLRDPTHLYTNSGTYAVTLTASNAYGSSTLTRAAAVVVDYIPPVADFDAAPTSGASPLVVAFTDRSSAGVATAWSWNFGDGWTSTLRDPSHTYTVAGTYTVSHTASNAWGSDSETKTSLVVVSAGPPLVADFVGAPTAGTAPLTVQFTDLSRGHILTWEWDFGDGTTSVEQHPSHTYTTPEAYNVSLVVTNADGRDSQLELSNYITVE